MRSEAAAFQLFVTSNSNDTDIALREIAVILEHGRLWYRLDSCYKCVSFGWYASGVGRRKTPVRTWANLVLFLKYNVPLRGAIW